MNILNQKFPCNTSWKSHFFSALGFGLFITVFLLIFKPFHLDTLPTKRLLFLCGMYGLVTFACIFIVALIGPTLFPTFFKEETWTTGKQILIIAIIVMLIGLSNYLLAHSLTGSDQSFRNFLWYQGITLLIGLLPITIFTLLKWNRLLRKFEEQAAALEKRLQEKLEPEKKPEAPNLPDEKKNDLTVIELNGDYHGERIVLPPEDLYFIVAANNYIKVYFIKKEKVSYSILRMTMKKAEEVLQPWPGFFRCHRAYIVNLDKVQHVEGNAQGYRLRLNGVEEAIPVSRNLNSEFSDKLFALRNSVG